MPRILTALLAGVVFGVGLTLSQMIDPARVLGFLDVAGNWDPTLAFVMAGALAVAAAVYRVVFARPRPLFDEHFHVPPPAAPDARLLAGAALFGLGWGLVGFCPGPALAALAGGAGMVFVFVAAMLAGTLLGRSPAVQRWLA